MAAVNPPNKAITPSKHKLREDQVITAYAKSWDFYDRNRKLVYGILAGIAVLVIAVVGYVFYMSRQEAKAGQEMAGAVAAYERGEYRMALDGTDEWTGLLEIADDYGNTDAGNLAYFYAGDALYKLGEYDQALDMFEAFDKEENLLGAGAIAGEAAIHEIKGEFQEAGETYERAAEFYESDLTTPVYLFNAARAYEEAGAFEEAVAAYEEVVERFPDSIQAGAADFFIAQARAKAVQPS